MSACSHQERYKPTMPPTETRTAPQQADMAWIVYLEISRFDQRHPLQKLFNCIQSNFHHFSGLLFPGKSDQ